MEWTDNPVTVALKYLCMRELNLSKSLTVTQCLYPCNPQKTQEELIEQSTKQLEWQTFLNLLVGKFQYELGDLDNFDKLVEEYDVDEESDEYESE